MKKVIKTNKQTVATVQPIATPVTRTTPILGLTGNSDMLVTTGNTWNSSFSKIVPVIGLRDPETNVLASFEYVPKRFPGSKWSILETSDTKQEVGVPFKDSYSVLDNDGLLTVLECLITGLEKLGIKPTIETSGTLNDRARQFVSIKLEGLDEFKIDGRVIHSFLNVLNSIDKSCNVTFANNTFTVCCKNTFAKALHGKDAPFHCSLKHCKGMKARLEDVPKLVEAFITGNERIFKQLKAWSEFPLTVTQAEQLFAGWLGDEGQAMSTRTGNVVERLKELFSRGKGNKGETAFDVFNAVTEYYTHESAGKSDDINKQFESSEAGDASKAKREFYEYLAKITQSGDAFKGVCKVGDKILIAYNKAKIDKAASK